MSERRKFWFSLETKVMVAVIAVLVALPALTLTIVDRQVTRQIQLDAALSASTAHDSFQRMLQVRTEELALRFRNIAQTNPGFLRVLRLGDAATMRDALNQDVLGQFRDTAIAAFITRQGEVWGTRRDNSRLTPEAFAAAADALIRRAAQGEEREGFVAQGDAVYRVIALPVIPPEGIMGVLVFALPIGRDVLQQIKPPLAEIVLIAHDHPVASTFAQGNGLGAELEALTVDTAQQGNRPVEIRRIGTERYQPALGELDAAAGIRYVLLSSSEQRLLTLERTKLSIFAASLAGIIACAAVVWFFVRRITQPLSALRDSADAVGRGDFSRRIERFSNDECGDLAEAFNAMTANLQSSRAELERAVQQVKTTQEQLIQSEKLSAVGQFVAGVAHELNNPLTSVVGFSELLQGMPDDPRNHEFLDKIAKSAHRCHKIVQSLLGFARQHAPERKPVDLATSMDEVLEIMAYDLRTSTIRVVREFAPDVPIVIGDAHQLQQVFINIIANARQAIEPVRREGEIAIRIRRAGTRASVEFADNGPGIRAEHLARIFDPFFTTKPVGKGTGLGLSLCYGIIQEHGGTIVARSEPGQGATFTIDLPGAAGAGRADATPALTDDPSQTSRIGAGKSVLVIDDEAWILELAAELLRGEGYTVHTVSGGQEAVELLTRRTFDVIVADWKMPGLNGIHLYEYLHATDPTLAKRLVYMTGDVVNDTFQDFLRERGMSCLAKPFAVREFKAAVAKVIAA